MWTVELTVKAKPEGGAKVLQIHDRGAGVPEHILFPV